MGDDKHLTDKQRKIRVKGDRRKKEYTLASTSTTRQMMVGAHSGSTVGLFLFNFVIFGGTVAFLHLSVFTEFTAGVYQNDIRNTTALFQLTVTPADWTHFIWTVIFGTLLMAKLYSLTLFCRRNAVGPVYTSPRIVSRTFMLIYITGLITLSVWVVLWDRQFLIASCAVLGSASILMLIATAVLHYRVYYHGAWMSRHLKVDIWFYRVLWHNGMAALTTALIMSAIYMIAVVLRYDDRVNLGSDTDADQITAYIVLGSISGVMLLWFVLENTALDRFMRYTVTIYPVIITFLVGIYTQQYADSTAETGYFLVALLGVAVFCLVARIGLLVLRTAKSPLYTNNKISDDPVLSFSS